MELKWLIEHIFDPFPLLTQHQRERYYRLRWGILNKKNRVNNLEEYQEFLNTSFTEGILTTPPIYFDNWISGFINGEASFHASLNGISIFYIEQAESQVLEWIKQKFEFGPKVLTRLKRSESRKETYSLSISSKPLRYSKIN